MWFWRSQQPWVAIDNDSEGTSPEGKCWAGRHPHPRAYGTFPRILAKYVRDEHKLTLEDAIRKFSALPAAHMRFGDRGVIKAGDVGGPGCVFDPGARAVTWRRSIGPISFRPEWMMSW